MGWCSLFLLLCISWSFFILGTHQLQSSQTQVLLQLRKQLGYPKPLDIWSNKSMDFCYLSSSQVNVTCEANSVTELRIVGDRPVKVSNFDGFSIPDQTLSQNFSMDSFIATLSRLSSLRTLTMVSVGIWGPLPDKIHRLDSIESLDLSWNFLYGLIPPTIPRMVKLQTIKLDGNFFNCTFPDWFGSLSNLTSLSLTNNQLTGSLPSSVQGITTLTDLVLSNNKISGKLPDLSSLSSLRFLDLSNNKLEFELPSMPKGLAFAFLSHNSFSGEIPRQYNQLTQIQKLDLSFNSLEGTPPAAIFSLPNLVDLNFASNMFSGPLPVHLSCSSKLGSVDISNNRLSGRLPSCLSNLSNGRVVKYGGNCLSIDLLHQHPEPFCTEVHMERKKSKSTNIGILVGIVGGIFLVMVILAYGFIVVCRKHGPWGTPEQHLLQKSTQENSVTGFPSEILISARYISEAAKLGTQGVPQHRLFSFEELKEATGNFNQSVLMGEGSTGKLYSGRLENGTQVAIKFLTVSKRYTIRNLKLRLDLLAKLRHPHLVCLLGHCIVGEGQYDSGGNKVCLVYEYVANGSYHSHLSEKVLNWSDRLSILIGVAKAVHFLHTGVIPGFFNNRLRASNILLNEHRMAKLSDYGLSIVAEEIDEHEGKGDGLKTWQTKNQEDDVYSFGFVILDSLVGPLTSAQREAFLVNEMGSLGSQDGRKRVVDPAILASCSQESLAIVISILSKCISHDLSTRPSFEDVLWNLQYAAQVQANADGEQKN